MCPCLDQWTSGTGAFSQWLQPNYPGDTGTNVAPKQLLLLVVTWPRLGSLMMAGQAGPGAERAPAPEEHGGLHSTESPKVSIFGIS